MKTVLIVLIVIVVVISVLYLVIRYELNKVKAKIRSATGGALGNGNFLDDYNKIVAETAQTPKSVRGMTSIYLPQIMRDFPEFNYDEFKSRAQNMLLSAFAAISAGDITMLSGAGNDLSDKVEALINSDNANGCKECYRDIKIHRTEISYYRKLSGTCTVILESTMQYFYTKKRISDGKLLDGSDELLHQAKYDIQLMYIQDAEKAEVKGGSDNAVGSNCPNCGAPVTSLGEKVCKFCGTAIEPINIRVWSLNEYKEI